MCVSNLTNGCKKAITLDVNATELSVLILGVEDRIADLKLRIATGAEFGADEDAMQHRRKWLAAAESVLTKLQTIQVQ